MRTDSARFGLVGSTAPTQEELEKFAPIRFEGNVAGVGNAVEGAEEGASAETGEACFSCFGS